MRNLLIGLLLGIILCTVGGYIMYPTVKKTSYDEGYKAGMINGNATGLAEGKTQGAAEVRAEIKHHEDSLAADIQKKEAERKAAMKKVHKAPPPVQNWHVIDGKIADPVVN